MVRAHPPLLIVTGVLDTIRKCFGRAEQEIEDEPVATPAHAGLGDEGERETSTNAQMEGASGEPWPGNE